MNICKNCGFEFEGNFCPKCGTKFSSRRICRNCGEEVVWEFCPKCGVRYEDDGEFFKSDLCDVTLSSGADEAGDFSSFLFADNSGHGATPVAGATPSSDDEALKPEAYSKCVEVYRHKKLFTFSFIFVFLVYAIVYMTFSYNYDQRPYLDNIIIPYHSVVLSLMILLIATVVVYSRQLAGAKRYGIKNIEKAYYARSTTLFLTFDVIVFLFCLACTILPFYRMTNPEHTFNSLVNGMNIAYGIVFIVCDLLFLASVAFGLYVRRLTHKLRVYLFGSEDFKSCIFVVTRDELSRDSYLIYNRVTGVTGNDRSFFVKAREHLVSILLLVFTLVLAFVGSFYSFTRFNAWRVTWFGNSGVEMYWEDCSHPLGIEDERDYNARYDNSVYYWYERAGKDGTKCIIVSLKTDEKYVFYDTNHIYSGEGDFSTKEKEVREVAISIDTVPVVISETGDEAYITDSEVAYAVRYRDGSYFESYLKYYDYEITDIGKGSCTIKWSNPLGSYSYTCPYEIRGYMDGDGVLTGWCVDDGTIDIPNGIVEMTYDALNGVTYIDNVSLPSSLKNFVVPDGVISINSHLFRDFSHLESVTLFDSVTTIGIQAFYNCTSLTSVIIGKSVSFIDHDAFAGCSSLETVYYRGNSSDWSAISIGSSNNPLTAATRYYYSETEPEDDGDFWHYVNGEPVAWTED